MGNKTTYNFRKLKQLKPNETLIELMSSLVVEGYKTKNACSNSIRKTCLTVLSKLGVMEFMDLVISNEDVKNGKPHPEMYWKVLDQ